MRDRGGEDVAPLGWVVPGACPAELWEPPKRLRMRSVILSTKRSSSTVDSIGREGVHCVAGKGSRHGDNERGAAADSSGGAALLLPRRHWIDEGLSGDSRNLAGCRVSRCLVRDLRFGGMLQNKANAQQHNSIVVKIVSKYCHL